MANWGEMFGEAFSRSYGNAQELAFKKWQIEQGKASDKINLLKMGYVPSKRPKSTVPPGMYIEMGKGDGYRYSPELAKQQMMQTMAPYMALSGNTEGLGAFVKGISGKNVQVGVDNKAEIYKRGSDLRQEFLNRPEVKEYVTINTQVKSMDSLLKSALSGNVNNKISLDQALITMFNKLTDPTSVVRESEYARTPENIPFVNRIPGAIAKLQEGGAGLTDKDREALVWGAKVIADERGKTFNETYTGYEDLAETMAKVPKTMVTRGMKQHTMYNKKAETKSGSSFKVLGVE